jgi:cytochrome c5
MAATAAAHTSPKKQSGSTKCGQSCAVLCAAYWAHGAPNKGISSAWLARFHVGRAIAHHDNALEAMLGLLKVRASSQG